MAAASTVAVDDHVEQLSEVHCCRVSSCIVDIDRTFQEETLQGLVLHLLGDEGYKLLHTLVETNSEGPHGLRVLLHRPQVGLAWFGRQYITIDYIIVQAPPEPVILQLELASNSETLLFRVTGKLYDWGPLVYLG